MPRGGKRPGAGRPPGSTRAKAPAPIAEARAEVKRVLASATSPLAVLCQIAADETQPVAVRMQAAASAAPFLYPRLTASVVADLSAPKDERPSAAALLSKLSDQFKRLAPPEPAVVAVDAAFEPEPEALPMIEHDD